MPSVHKASKIAMTGTRAENMRGNEEPRSFYKACIERVAQIYRRPFRIDAAKIAQGREAVVHVFTGESESFERLGRRRMERLECNIRSVHRQVDMGVNKSGTDSPLGKIDYPRPARSDLRKLHRWTATPS